MKIANVKTKDVQDFLEKTFEPDGSLYDAAGKPADRRSDMAGYAMLAKFLSDDGAVAGAAAQLAGLLGGFALNLNQHCPDGVSDPFLEVLRTLGVFYGFNPTHCYTLDYQVGTDAFRWVVSQKSLFHDAFTRRHGEYTHAMQWLLMALRFGSSLPVSDLYARSVAYISKEDKKFITGREGKAERIYLWNFLVDCFKGKKDDENFTSNIICRSFRCPQIVTQELVQVSPESWFGHFILRMRRRGLKRGEPAPSPRYEGGRYISYTPREREENLKSGLWERTCFPNVYRVVSPRILVH